MLWEHDINQLTFVFPFAETRSIKRMWREYAPDHSPKMLTWNGNGKINTVSAFGQPTPASEYSLSGYV